MVILQNTTPHAQLNTLCSELANALIEQIRIHIDNSLLINDAELLLRLVDEVEITSLNQQFRDKDSATNVLSFPDTLPHEISPSLGDIVICIDVVKREAIQQNKSFEHHLTHIILHGILHLLGYDHIKEDDATEMERLETAILHKLNISNPYT